MIMIMSIRLGQTMPKGLLKSNRSEAILKYYHQMALLESKKV